MILIFTCTYAVGMQNIEFPGVYYDAVYPDYIASVLAFPGIDNFTQITQHVGLPLLGNFYHGTLTAAIQFLVLKCAGTANVYTLRMTNLFYISIIGCILFSFTQKISRKYFIPLIGSLLCVTSQNVFIFSRTQYYIMLPGVIFFLLSCDILLTEYLLHGQCSKQKLLLAGIFQGIAFYGYFTFLLLVPPSIVIIAIYEQRQKKLAGAVTFLWGILLGSILYFFAYYDSLLVNIMGFSLRTKIFLLLGCAIMCFIIVLPIVVFILPAFQTNHEQFKRRLIKVYCGIGLSCLLIGIIIAAAAVFVIPEKLQAALNVIALSKERNSEPRFFLFWILAYELLSSDLIQSVMFSDHLNDCGAAYLMLCGIITTVVCILHYAGKLKINNSSSGKFLKFLYFYLLGFYLCSLPIVTGMQPQHFVITYFLMFAAIILGLCHITDSMLKQTALFIIILLSLFGVGINCNNNRIFLDKLAETGGRGRYSSAYNDFAYEAYADTSKENKIYVFPEWGFHANFVYLTANTCTAIRPADVDIDILRAKMEDGYTIVLSASETQTLNDLLEDLSYDECAWNRWQSKEGNEVFFSAEIKINSGN